MLLYRAMSRCDVINYNNEDDIHCSLYNSIYLPMEKTGILMDTQAPWYNCYNGDCVDYVLDVMVGHVSGKKLQNNTSPYISASDNLRYVMSEYAVPQAGNFNHQKNRKPIMVINVDEEDVISDVPTLMNIRNNNDHLDGLAIDVRNNLLDKYYVAGAISAETYNEYMPGYDENKTKNRTSRNNVAGFSRFATSAGEVLFYDKISRNQVELILYPILQDLIYSWRIDDEKAVDFIKSNYVAIMYILKKEYDKMDDFEKALYHNVTGGITLIDYLFNHYNEIEGDDIHDKYHALKMKKLHLLERLTNEISFLKPGLKVCGLIDDQLLVSKYYEISDEFSSRGETAVNDLLLVEKDNRIYKYENESHKYVSKDGSKISKADITRLARIKIRSNK